MAATRVEDLKPVYLIYGKEDLLLEHALERLRERVAAVADLDFNFEAFDGENADAGSIVAAANTLPFASERRLVVVRNVEKMSASEHATLAEYATDPAPTACVVLVARTVTRTSKLYRAVEALGGVAEYKAPKRNEYAGWARRLFESRGRAISADAAEHLVRSVGRDLRRLESETEKILAFVGDRARVEREDVEAVVAETAPISIFEFLDAVGAREAGVALVRLDELLDAGESLMGVHAMAVRHIRSLLSARSLLDRDETSAVIGQALGIAEWQVRNLTAQARRFEQPELVAALHAAVEAESAIKRGEVEQRLAFERWVVATCGS